MLADTKRVNDIVIPFMSIPLPVLSNSFLNIISRKYLKKCILSTKCIVMYVVDSYLY